MIQTIRDAKTAAGPDAYLWLDCNTGHVIIWEAEAESENDNGAKAVHSFDLLKLATDAIIDSGLCDGVELRQPWNIKKNS